MHFRQAFTKTASVSLLFIIFYKDCDFHV